MTKPYPAVAALSACERLFNSRWHGCVGICMYNLHHHYVKWEINGLLKYFQKLSRTFPFPALNAMLLFNFQEIFSKCDKCSFQDASRTVPVTVDTVCVAVNWGPPHFSSSHLTRRTPALSNCLC